MAKATKRARTRVEAGLVEEDFEQKPSDETMAAGDGINLEAVAEAVEDANALGAAHASVIQSNPSDAPNPYVSPEEQFMEMAPVVVGPPAYGSPDPLTAAGRLVSVTDHPLGAGKVPDGSSISDDYGADVTGAALAPGETSHPGGPQRSDLEIDTAGGQAARLSAGEEVVAYDEATKEELLEEASKREIPGRSSMNKEELVEALVAYDEAASTDES